MARLQHITNRYYKDNGQNAGNFGEGNACKCEERKKALPARNWSAQSWLPYKCYGPNCSNYDGRLLLDLTCNNCGATWRNKNKNSPIWKLINRSPRSTNLHPFIIQFNNINP